MIISYPLVPRTSRPCLDLKCKEHGRDAYGTGGEERPFSFLLVFVAPPHFFNCKGTA